MILALSASVALAILFDEKKRKERNSPKYRSFPKRVAAHYKTVDSLMKKTVAKELYKETKEKYQSDLLNDLEIENGEFIDI